MLPEQNNSDDLVVGPSDTAADLSLCDEGLQDIVVKLRIKGAPSPSRSMARS